MENKPLYTLQINSSDKISGYNNDGFFQVNWRDFLPEKWNRYNTGFSFALTEKGNYTNSDFSYNDITAITYYTYEYGQEKTTFTYDSDDDGWRMVQQDMSESGYDYLFSFSNLRAYCGLTSEAALFCCPIPVTAIDRNDYDGFKFSDSFGNPNFNNDPNGHPAIIIYSEDNLVQNTNLSNSTKTLIANVLPEDSYIQVNTIDHIFVGQYLKFQGQSYADVDYTTTVSYIYGHRVYFNSPNDNNIMVAAFSGDSVTFFFCQNGAINSALVNFNSARIETNFNSRSYSFQTSNSCPSSILGHIYNDGAGFSANIQSNPITTISRPSNNLLHIRILNDMPFAGGILSVNNGTPAYSYSKTTKNLLTDTTTDISGNTVFATSYDMTNWVMTMFLSPIENDERKNQYET